MNGNPSPVPPPPPPWMVISTVPGVDDVIPAIPVPKKLSVWTLESTRIPWFSIVTP